MVAKGTLITFGDVDHEKAPSERKVWIMGTKYRMTEVSVGLSICLVVGSFLFYAFVLIFRYRTIPFVAEQLELGTSGFRV